MFRIDTDYAFKLAADNSLDINVRKKVREIIRKSLNHGNDEYFHVFTRVDAELFKNTQVSKTELFIKIAELGESDNPNRFNLQRQIVDIIDKMFAESKKLKEDITVISLNKLPKEIQGLFEEKNVKEVDK